MIEAECTEVNKKLVVKEDALKKAVTKIEKLKVDDKQKFEASENIRRELIAKDDIIKSLRLKLSEANKITETIKSRPQQMEGGIEV